MKLVVDNGPLNLTLTEVERAALVEALDDVVDRYEAADEHIDNAHYAVLRHLAEALDARDV